MDLNIQDWKWFKILRIFRIENCKCNDASSLEDGSDINYIGAKWNDNGVMKTVAANAKMTSKGNCIVFICSGEGSAGDAIYQNKEFIGSTTLKAGYIDGILNAKIGMFLSTLLCLEYPKYGFGRKWLGERFNESIIKLPIQHNPDGTPVIDANKTYSDEGYIPDWQFMENYIKNLHSKPITTTRKATESLSLGVEKWKEFNLSDIFTADTGNTDITQELLTDDGEIVVSAGESNTGVIGRCSVKAKIFPQNTITLDMFGFAFPRPYEYKMVTHARIFSLSVKNHIMSHKQSIFMATMLNNSEYKYAYGRICSWERVKNDTISLPIQRDASDNPIIDPDKKYSDKGYIPDWDFMERYIDRLPYSDKIA